MKKIAFFINSLERGGAEHVTVRLTDFFTKNGIECYIITNKIGSNEYTVPQNVKRFFLSNKKKISNIFRLRKLLKSLTPTALVVMGTSEAIIAIPAAAGLGIRTVISERNDPTNYLGNKLVISISRFLMRYADDFIFQTEQAKLFYDKKLKGKGQVIYNPIIASDIPNPWDKKRARKIVAVGRLEPQKNHKLLIEAFSDLCAKRPEFQLEIYGNGSLKDMLNSEILKRKMEDKILLCGNHPDVLARIRNAYAFVLPSNFEGMPNALIEAMCLGLPCISTDCPCGGPSALIQNHNNGILIPCNDKNALVDALLFLIENPSIAEAYGQKALEVKELLDISNIGKQWESIIFGDCKDDIANNHI